MKMEEGNRCRKDDSGNKIVSSGNKNEVQASWSRCRY